VSYGFRSPWCRLSRGPLGCGSLGFGVGMPRYRRREPEELVRLRDRFHKVVLRCTLEPGQNRHRQRIDIQDPKERGFGQPAQLGKIHCGEGEDGRNRLAGGNVFSRPDDHGQAVRLKRIRRAVHLAPDDFLVGDAHAIEGAACSA